MVPLMTVDIPEFHGGIRIDSFLDWLVDVEEILEFRSVPDDGLVSLVSKKFRGEASSWWHQLKKTRMQEGKNPIKSWDKLKQKLCITFIPRNYDYRMYYHLKKLKQGEQFNEEEQFDGVVSNTNLSVLCSKDMAEEDQVLCVGDSKLTVQTWDGPRVDDFYDEDFVEVIMKNCCREDLIGILGVKYLKLSPIDHIQVLNNFDEKDEDIHMDKRNYDSSNYLENYHRQIKREPPDRCRNGVSFLSGVKYFTAEAYGEPCFDVYVVEDTSYIAFDGNDNILTEVEVIRVSKSLITHCQCGLTGEDLLVRYQTNKKDEELYMFSSKTDLMNFAFGKRKPMQISSYLQSDVFDGAVYKKIHVDFLFYS